jgi:co-chaperonin GroES (HSP10)
MLKKAIGYGIVGLLALILIVGTVSIVLHPSDTRAWQGRSDPSATGHGQDQERERTQTDESGTGYRGGGERLGGATGSETPITTGQWETVSGVVTVADTNVTLRTASGDVIIGMGPARYREEARFTVNVGDEIVVSGYMENEEFKAGTVENRTTGKTIVLRDETGHPVWAGQGNLRNQQP